MLLCHKGPSSQSYGFSSSHVQMWELDYKESWVLKKLMLLNCGVREDSWESPGHQETQPVHSKGNQSWIFIGRTDAEAETPILWPPDVKNWLIWKRPDAGKDWRWEEEGITEDEIVGGITPQWTWVWVISGSWWWTGKPGVLQVHGVAKSQTRLSAWTELNAGRLTEKEEKYTTWRNLIWQ